MGGKGPLDLGAWRGDPALKNRVVELMREDQAMDRFQQGEYLRDYNPFRGETPEQGFRGCHIGCLMMAHKRATQYTPYELAEVVSLASMALAVDSRAPSWHDEMPDALGIPSWLGHVWDSTFEQVSPARASLFAVCSLEVLPVGADCRPLMPMLAAFLLSQVAESRYRPSDAFSTLKDRILVALGDEILRPDPMVWISLRDAFREIAGWSFRDNRFDKFTYSLIACMSSLGAVPLMEAAYEAACIVREGNHVAAVADLATGVQHFMWTWAEALLSLCERLPLVGQEAGQ